MIGGPSGAAERCSLGGRQSIGHSDQVLGWNACISGQRTRDRITAIELLRAVSLASSPAPLTCSTGRGQESNPDAVARGKRLHVSAKLLHAPDTFMSQYQGQE